MKKTFSPLDRARAWLVTGAPGRAYAFVLDFSAGVLTMLRSR